MSGALPSHYFRVREHGATCFRLARHARHGRLDLVAIAQINLRKGEVKPQGDTVLTAADRAEIDGWIAARRAVLAQRRADEVQQTLEALNATAHWAQSAATPEQLEAVSDALLLAMHDLRAVLVRKKAARIEDAED